MRTLIHIYTQSCQSGGGPTQTNKHPPNDEGHGGSKWVAQVVVVEKKKRVMLCFLGSTVEKKSRRAGAEGEEMDECGWT